MNDKAVVSWMEMRSFFKIYRRIFIILKLYLVSDNLTQQCDEIKYFSENN